jgi:acetyltransferase-like isoleucine patch superfamily enzyme
LRNQLANLENTFRNNKYRVKGSLLKIYLAFHGCKTGRGLRCHSFPCFRISPNKNIIIGDRVSIGYNITLEVLENGVLKIGDNVKLTQDILISAGLSVVISSNTLVGERVSIRDGNHSFKSKEIILKQPNVYKPIIIGQDVWIGAGCFVLSGSIIPDGVVIGANSVINKKSILSKNCIYAGSPVKFIKERN